MTETPTTEVAVVDPVFSGPERYALGAYLAGYQGLTRDAYALGLRQFIAWCDEHNMRLFTARRADIECLARDLEERGRARATVARRLCTVPASTGTRSKKGCWIGHRRCMFVDLVSTTSLTRTDLTATRSAHCSSPPGSPPRATTRSSRCWRSTVCGSPRRSELTSRRSASNAGTAR